MKKIILLLLLFPTIVFAQHLKFMGIPINGDLTSFGKQLQSKGFKIEKTENGHMTLSGKFAGEKVELLVRSSMKTKSVCGVVVLFDQKTSWPALKSQYERLKENYSSKYKILKEYHFFKDPYYEGDGYEMSAVRIGKCMYCAFYKLEYGRILLTIYESGCVMAAYEDKQNTEKANSEQSSRILEDI